jgi:thioesterase DpgC
MMREAKTMGEGAPEVNAECDPLRAAGLSEAAVGAWLAARPRSIGDYDADYRRYQDFWRHSNALLAALPKKPSRNAAEAEAARTLLTLARESREVFLSAHAETVYDTLTHACSRFLRVEDLVFAAAEAFPGLTPTTAQLAAESAMKQGDKDGLEIDQGIFLAHVLADERCGLHLCHAMLLPRPESADLLERFSAAGTLDLGAARLERKRRAVHLVAGNLRFLNAEDNDTLDVTEAAVDVAILDPETDIAVLRGAKLEHPKYRGRHVFGTGINLTRLYRGEIPFLWFLKRDMGYVHKLLRGIALPDALPDDVHGRGVEKPWIAAVDTFAIGGHCQLLLAADYVLAANDAIMTLPARKEGIIPGLANLRLPRFTGDRIARQAIQYGRELPCDSPEGRLICDELAAPDEMDAAIERVVTRLTSSGAVSAVANRCAFRVGQEPLDLFRRYCSVYAREQAYCHFSQALIANLERHWNAKERTI